MRQLWPRTLDTFFKTWLVRKTMTKKFPLTINIRKQASWLKMFLHLHQSQSMTWFLNHFIYLCSTITNNISCDMEIDKCITKETEVMAKVKYGTTFSWYCAANERYFRHVSLVVCFTAATPGQHASDMKSPWKASFPTAYDISSASRGETNLPTLLCWSKQTQRASIFTFVNVIFNVWGTYMYFKATVVFLFFYLCWIRIEHILCFISLSFF